MRSVAPEVAVAGGAPITLCDAPFGRGASWSDDGFIIFSPTSAPGTALQRVSADGGKPEQLFPLAAGEGVQRWPQVLPGGKAELALIRYVFEQDRQDQPLTLSDLQIVTVVVVVGTGGGGVVVVTGGGGAGVDPPGELGHVPEGNSETTSL